MKSVESVLKQLLNVGRKDARSSRQAGTVMSSQTDKLSFLQGKKQLPGFFLLYCTGRQLSRQSFNMAQDTFAFTLLNECGQLWPRQSPNVVWSPEIKCILNASFLTWMCLFLGVHSDLTINKYLFSPCSGDETCPSKLIKFYILQRLK